MRTYDVKGPGAMNFALSYPDVLPTVADLLEIPDISLVVVQGVASNYRLVCSVAWLDPKSNQPVVHDARVVYLEDELNSRHLTVK